MCSASNDPEDGLNGEDEDCDGSTLVRRDYLTAFEFATDWTLAHGSVGGGAATLSPRAAEHTTLFLPPDGSGELFGGVSGELTVGVFAAAWWDGTAEW